MSKETKSKIKKFFEKYRNDILTISVSIFVGSIVAYMDEKRYSRQKPGL